MGEAIKVIVKQPNDKYGKPTKIVPSLENLQSVVGGYIEHVNLGDGLALICNEEGKLKGMEPNFVITSGLGYLIDEIVGPVIIAGVKGEELADIPISYAEWKRYLWKWGN